MLLTVNNKKIFKYILFLLNGILAGFSYIMFQRYVSDETTLPLFSLNRIVIFLAIFIFVFWLFLNSDSVKSKNCIDRFICKISTHPMFSALCLIVIIRMIYRSYFVPSTIYYDTKTYTNFGYNIFLGETDIFRTPGYPYFLKFIRIFVSDENLFYTYVALFQSFLTLASVVVLYLAGRKLFKSKLILTSACFIYGIAPCVVNFDTCILTESLSIFGMVLLIYLVFSFLAKPKTYMAVIIGIYSFVMVMIRPTFVYFYAILGVFFIARFIFNKQDRKKCLYGALSLALSGLMLLGYCGLNYKNYSYFNISSVSVTVNKLYVVMDNKWVENSDYPEISAYLTEKMNSVEFSEWIPSIIEKLPEAYSYKQIDEFVNDCVKKHKSEFIDYNINKFLSLAKTPLAVQYSSLKADYKDTAVSNNLSLFNNITFPFTFAQCFLLVLFTLAYSIAVLIKKKRICWHLLGLSAIIFTHIFVSVYGAMMEWERLSVMIVPAVVLLVFYFADKLFTTFDCHITDNNSTKISIKEVG